MQVELILLVLSLLFFASIFTDKIGYKFGVPALLLFLAVGMLFGPDGIGRLINDDGVDYMLNVGSAQAIGTIALCIILFSPHICIPFSVALSSVHPVLLGIEQSSGTEYLEHLFVAIFCIGAWHSVSKFS